MKNSNLLIDHCCPQCGAPAVLTETERLFTCEFCRVKSYLSAGSGFRYLLPGRAPPGRDLYYYPYWRFKGMLFSCVRDGVRHKFIDVSHQAAVSRHFPLSLGFRSQALKLRFVTPETEGRFLPVQLPLDEVMQTFTQSFSLPLPQPIFHQAHVGELVSLVYAPFYGADRLYDAVLNEPFGEGTPQDIDARLAGAGPSDWHLRFLATLCPACGWDLEGSPETLVLTCPNCDSAWKPAAGRLERLDFGHLPPPPGSRESILYLPFWRTRPAITGLVLDTFADLVAVANLPIVPRPDRRERPFHFWSPAFKIRPQTYLPLATRMTLAQPQDEPAAGLPGGDLHPVTLPSADAADSLKITLAAFVKPRKTVYPRLATITVAPQSCRLVYVPFVRNHHDLTQPSLKISVPANQLALAGNL
ncbi:MAG: hypothetical protein WAM73_18010 [Desulfobacterales bacterium]